MNNRTLYIMWRQLYMKRLGISGSWVTGQSRLNLYGWKSEKKLIFSWRRSEVQCINSYQIAKWLGSDRSILIWRKRPNILGQWSDNSVYINLLENHCCAFRRIQLFTLILVNGHQNLLPTSIWSIQLTLSYDS